MLFLIVNELGSRTRVSILARTFSFDLIVKVWIFGLLVVVGDLIETGQ